MKTKIFAIVLSLGVVSLAAPAQATFWGWGSGHCKKNCGSTSSSTTSSTTGGHTTSTTGGHTTSGGTSGGTQVPEPGMLGLFAAGVVGIGMARRRRRSTDA